MSFTQTLVIVTHGAVFATVIFAVTIIVSAALTIFIFTAGAARTTASVFLVVVIVQGLARIGVVIGRVFVADI
jgi:hypothetical protein